MIEQSIVHLPELVKDIDRPVSIYLVHLSSDGARRGWYASRWPAEHVFRQSRWSLRASPSPLAGVQHHPRGVGERVADDPRVVPAHARTLQRFDDGDDVLAGLPE